MLILVLLGVLAVPLAIGVAHVARTHWYPTGDYAYVELSLRAIPRHLPLTGPAGRFGPIEDQGSHPGPSMAYALFPVYLLLGRSALGMMVSTTVLHLAAAAIAVVVGYRIGGRSLAVALAVVVAIVDHSSGAQLFLEPWNPWIATSGYLAFLLLVAAALRGRWWALPAAVVAGSYCAEMHAGYVLLVAGVLAGALAYLVLAARRGWDGLPGERLRRALAWSVVVGVIAWLPPLYDELFRSHNLTRLLRYFTRSGQPIVGWRAATRAMIAEWNLGGAWLSGAVHDPATSPPSLTGFVLFAAFVAGAVVVAVRRRDVPALHLLGVALGAAFFGWVSAARIVGDFYDYVIRWSWTIAALLAAAAGWAWWRAAAASVRGGDLARLRRFGALGAALVIAVPTLALARQGTSVEVPIAVESRLVGALAEQAAPALDRSARYLIRWHDPAGLGGPGGGLMLELERRGFHVRSDPWTRYAVLPYRVTGASAVDAVLWVVTGDVSIERFRARGDVEELAYADPRTPADRERSDADRAAILDQLAALGRDDLIGALDTQYGNAVLIAARAELPGPLDALIAEYTDLRLPGAVFRVAPDAPLFP